MSNYWLMRSYSQRITLYYLTRPPKKDMTSRMSTEEELSRDVEALRARFPHTQELYREVCALLFFRYGITPTANKLYQLVRKGSMSAPSQALSKFWEELRTKSRTRIEHPDLPEDLGTLAGGLLAELWTRSQALAQATLAAHRREAEEAVVQARSEASVLQSKWDDQERTISSLQEALDRANQMISAQREDLAAAHQARSSLMEMLEGAKRDNRESQQQHEAARLEFSSELEKLRAAAKLSDDRTWATEKRLLIDIDRERTGSAKLQKELDAHRTESSRAAEQQHQELSAAQLRLSDSQQEKARLEGILSAVTANLERAESELKALQTSPAKPELGTPTREEERKNKSRRSSRLGSAKSSSTLRQRFGST